MHFYDFFTPEKKEELKKAAFEVFARKESFKGFVNPNLHKNGALVILETSGAPVLDQQGRLLGYRGGDIDITERKRAEQEVLRQNRLLEGINKVLRDTLRFETDEEVARTGLTVAQEITGSTFGWIGEVNPSGRLDTIAMSDPGWDFCRMDGAQAQPGIRNMEIRGIWGRVLKDGKSLIANDPTIHPDRVGLPSGHPALTAFLGVPLKKDDKTIGMISLANKPSGYTSFDQKSIEVLSVAIVEALRRKRAEDALRVSEERFRIAAECTNDLIWEWDVVNGTLEWFGAIDEDLGYSLDEFPTTQEAWEKIIHPDDYDRVMASVDRHFKTKAPYCEEYYIKRKDGTYRLWLDRGKAVWDAEGNPLKMIGAYIDITERKRAEEAVKASEKKYRTLFETSNDAILMLDQDGKFFDGNKAVFEMFGFSSKEDFITIHPSDLSPPKQPDGKDSWLFRVCCA